MIFALLIFNLRSRKLTIEPQEIERGKYYLFVIKNITDPTQFQIARAALEAALSEQKVHGLIVTKPLSAVAADYIARQFHWQWVELTKKTMERFEGRLPAELVMEWERRQVSYGDLPDSVQDEYRRRVLKMIDVVGPE